MLEEPERMFQIVQADILAGRNDLSDKKQKSDQDE